MKLNEKGKEKIKKQIIVLVPMKLKLDEALSKLNFSLDYFDEAQTISSSFIFLMGRVVNALEDAGKEDLADAVVDSLTIECIVDR